MKQLLTTTRGKQDGAGDSSWIQEEKTSFRCFVANFCFILNIKTQKVPLHPINTQKYTFAPTSVTCDRKREKAGMCAGGSSCL